MNPTKLDREVEQMNQQLTDLFGIDSLTGQPIWRIAWSPDQFENRYGTYDDFTPAGIYLRTVTEVRWVPKYRQWVGDRYVLERLVVVPAVNRKELPDAQLSYELLWIFEANNGDFLPPKLEAAQFIINTVLTAQVVAKNLIMGNEGLDKAPIVKYHDPEETQEAALELQKKRIDGIVEELYGDESGLTGTTFGSDRTSIIVPQLNDKVH